MKLRLFLFALILGSGVSIGADSVGDIGDELNMVVGEQKMFDASDIASFSESSRGIIQIKVPRDGKQKLEAALKEFEAYEGKKKRDKKKD